MVGWYDQVMTLVHIHMIYIHFWSAGEAKIDVLLILIWGGWVSIRVRILLLPTTVLGFVGTLQSEARGVLGMT